MLKELQEKFNLAVKTAETLLAKAERTEEEKVALDAAFTDANRLKGEIERAKEMEALKGWGSQSTPMLPLAGTGDEPKESKADDDQGWKSPQEFFKAVKTAATPGGRIDERLTKAASGLNESVPSDGGFLVQSDFSSELLKRAYETGVLASRVRRTKVSGNGLKINAIDETSRANGSRWGGVAAYWEGEADAFTASRPKFRQMEMTLKKLTGLCYATDEMLEDMSATADIMNQAFGEEFGFKIDDAIIRGTGAGMPLGILNADCLVSVAKESGQDADTIYFENIVKMWSRMWSRSRSNAVWLINQDVEPQLLGLSMVIGTGGVPVYLPPGGLSASPYGQLFGRPVIPIEQADTVGDQGDIILGDFSQYRMIDKGGMQSASSIHVRFLYDESVFRFTYRVDGQPEWSSALTPFQSSNTLSPFVVLDARA